MSGQLDLSTKTIKIYGGAFDAAARASILAHLADLDNPHEVSKADVGLGNVDNTSDADKPISTATAAALALKAPLVSPTFTGVPAAPTAAPGTVTTQLATTAFAQAAVNAILASPAFTGTPTAPTASPGTDTTQLATTAFVTAADVVVTNATAAALALKANLASPALTGTPTSTTASPGDNSVRIATTAFVTAADAVVTAAVALKADIASPTFTGVPAAPTAAPGTNTTQLATTAFVKAADDIVAAAAAAAQADADQALIDALPVPSLVAALRSDRPGEAVRLYGETKTGAPSAVTGIDPTWITTSASGSVVRVDGATADDPQTVAPAAAYALEDGKVYDIRYKVQRQTDPVDPLNDSVTLGIRWLLNTKGGVVSGGTTTVENIALVIADGVEERIVRVSMAARDDVDYVAPAGTIYFRPFIDLYGGNGVTDIIAIDVTPVVLETEVPFFAPGSLPMQSLTQRFNNLHAGYIPGMVRWGIGVDSAAEITVPWGLQIGSNVGDGVQLDPGIYIDRLLDTGSESAHGVSDETEYARTNGQYAAFDAKTRMRGEQVHFVGFQSRPSLGGGDITGFLHGHNSQFATDDAGVNVAIAVHFAALQNSSFAGTIDFEAGFSCSLLNKGVEKWGFYDIQNISRLRRITMAFGSVTSDALAINFFGDENTGFIRGAADTFSIITGGFRSLDVTTTGLSSVGSTGVNFFKISTDTDSFIRDDKLLGVTRFHTINAATGGSATGSVASIGARSGADHLNNEIALLAAGPDYNLTSDWLVQDGAALRSGTALSGGMSIAALAGGLRLYTANLALSIDHTTQHATFAAGITHGSTTLLTTTAALSNGAAAGAGTLTNAPTAGNPTKWVPINDNGTTRYIPTWT